MLHHIPLYSGEPRLTAFHTDRHGGVSIGNYASMNCNLYSGDRTEDVMANRRRIESETGMRLITPHQTHGTRLAIITNELLSAPQEAQATLLEDADAIATNLPGILIGIHTADCIPILLYDPAHQVCCAIHAGWRGTVARIAEKSIRTLEETYGTRGCDLHAFIGPGICRKAFETGEEVYDRFQQEGFDMDLIADRHPVTGKWHLDLKLANQSELQRCGVRTAHIKTSPVCTYTDEDYFSARRMGIQSGRILTGIGIR